MSSKDRASSSRNPQPLESNENRFDSASNNPTHVQFHHRRSPLNAIPDPSQLRRDVESDSDAPKLDGADGSQTLDDKTSVSSSEGLVPVGKYVSVWGLGTSTPKATSSRARVNTESNSAQSTPARSSGIRGLGTGSRVYQSNGGRTFSRISRRFTIVNTEHAETVVDAPHFELEEDPLFWKDHNVQVLIRVRPLNNMERVLQGNARCLKQENAHTLIWLGHPETRFTFDHVVCETITQEKLFRVAGLPMVENCMSGYNSCIFAYGQTGSGKTYTMMGEIHENEGNLDQDCGITPRIFEYLFTRIKAEEESRRDEKLTYNCKCSFLEIYNEQITDLLEPSSTNLQLREDFKKGVYVENLTEHNVRTVNDVLQLLLKGAANRKIAATHMNSESSRSHSVFTCIIESRWEKDSMIHSRYGRLNLVDLAGSERQKSSGAEGDRLKEAANINKSLSTLGLVIMSLVDVAHGKQRHVPYRDSRLTFLLQDSLGGNSKTTIIANVSPSFCSATETLSTLKFAQRAKLIQNNAKVNEDASGDVTALQEQVQRLKEQLSHLLNNQRQPIEQLLRHGSTQLSLEDFPGKFDPSVDVNVVYKQELRNANEKIKCLESALACSFKREKMAHTAVKKLEAELESRSTLVQHLEDEAHHRTTKLLLKEVIDSSLRDLEMKEADTISLGDTVSTRSDFGYDTTSNLAEDEIQLENSDYQMDGMTSLKPTVVAKELSDARLLIEALECEHIRLTQELQLTEERNQHLLDILGREHMQKNLLISSHYTPKEMQIPNNKNQTLMKLANEDFRSLALQAKLEKMSKELQEARTWNKQYQEDEALKLHHQKDVELIREQVEVETASTIIHLQEEIAMLQTELNERLSSLTAENNQLRNVIADKDDQLNDMSTQWEKATIELTSFLMDGSKSLNNASSRIRSMACLFPHANGSLGENIESAARACMEKEEMILLLQKSLEDAQKTVFEMEQKLNSLKGVAIAFTEAQHLVSTGCSEELYDESINNIKSMNCELDPLWNVADEVCEDPEASLSELKRLSHSSSLEHDFGKAPQMACNSEHVSRLISDTEAQAHESAIGESEVLIDSIRLRLQEFEGEALASYEDTEKHLSDFQKDILESSAVSKESVESLGKDTGASLGNIEHLKGKCNCLQFAYSEMPICEPSKGPNTNDHEMISCIREGLAETNNRLGLIQASVDKLLEAYADKWESDSSTSDSSLSLTSTSAGEKGPSYGSDSKCLHEVDGSMLIEELELASRAFRNLCVSLTSLVTQTDLTIKPHGDSNQSLGFVVNNNLCGHVSVNKKRRLSEVSCLPQSPNAGTEGAYLDSSCSKIFAPDGKMEQSSSFFSNFEEAYATMKEADLMLNKLVKSNENAKELAHMWKQVGKELKGERDCLLDQVQQLKSKLCSSKSEDGTLENEKSNLIEVTKSVSSLVDFFEDMRKDLEELLSGVYSDLLSMSKDVQSYVGSRRDLFEQICAEFIEKEFSSLVVHVCIGNYLSSMQGLCVQREQTSLLNEANSAAVNCGTLSREEGEKIVALPMLEIEESFPLLGNLSQENLQLKRELERKEVVLKGLLFDFTLLQEAASNRKDIRDEINKLIVALGQAEFELQVKRHDVNSLLLQVREMEESLTDTKHVLAISNSELEQTQRSLDTSSNDNHELTLLVNDLHRKKSEAEKQLDEQDEVIKGLEKEILHLTSLASERVFQSIENVEDDLLRVTAERNELREEIKSLTEKMEMACALAEENEAVALEAQQDSVASKIYAEQKEEEVKILESSIEELEDTVNVLEKKVQEMDEEVQKHRLDRNSLETEIQALRQRMLTVENLTENMDQEDSIHEKLENHVPRRFENQVLDLDQAYAQIKVLKRIRAEQAKEIDRMKEYVSELVLHAEAQASQYQQKYKTLEAMVCELKKKSSSMVSVAPVLEKPERSSSRPRRSSSPFRCISNLVHQMNVEKDHELSTAKARIEDLEVLAASRQKEVCMLSSRLAAAESMTHDVIRDLLGLKLDMTSYANLVDEHQLHRLLDVAQQKIAESKRKEEEIHKLKTQIHDLIDERDRCIIEINRRESNVLAARLTVKLLKERDQYLTVQNEMLKVEKTNLMHRLVQTESTADANASLEGR